MKRSLLPHSAKDKGILIASDVSQEWLLPWWWDHYQCHNTYPVCFIDLGMSQPQKTWCKTKGILIDLQMPHFFSNTKEEIDPKLASLWEHLTGTDFWDSRDAWFKKPFACLKSPFQKTIWLDLDCQVLKSLSPLFSYFKNQKPLFGIVPEIPPCSSMFNSGVILFSRDHPLLTAWANQTLISNHLFRGDQDILEHLISSPVFSITKLPLRYNWSRRYRKNNKAAIIHWHGSHGKNIIRHKLIEMSIKKITNLQLIFD